MLHHLKSIKRDLVDNLQKIHPEDKIHLSCVNAFLHIYKSLAEVPDLVG